MSNYLCKDCGTIVRHGMRCACSGRSKESLSKLDAPIVPCEVLGCSEPAFVRLQDGFILRPMCRRHYDRHFQMQASDYTRGLGLTTTEKKRAHCVKMLKQIGQKEGSKDWAYSLKSDYIDGKPLSIIQIEMASGAIGEVWNKRKCTPRVTA